MPLGGAADVAGSDILGGRCARSSRIRNELDEAQALREEAQKTVAEFKRKQRDALKEAEQILDHAKIEAKRLAERAERDLEAALERREQAALDKIAQADFRRSGIRLSTWP